MHGAALRSAQILFEDKMDKQRSWIVASVVLLLFASVALLLLTVHVDEIQEPPQYMVNFYFNYNLALLFSCPCFSSLSVD